MGEPFYKKVGVSGISALRRFAAMSLWISSGIVVSVLLFFVVRGWEQNEMQDDFLRESRKYALAVENSISESLFLLHSLDSFYAASQRVTRAEFRKFVAPILERHSGIVAIEWIPAVPDSQRLAYEQAVRNEGFHDFQISERQSRGEMVRAGTRPEYFPVCYIEPYEGNEAVLGFDIASEPRYVEALKQARNSGEVTATGRVQVLQEAADRYDVLVFLPVCDKTMRGNDEWREENFKGFFLGVFRVEQIVESALRLFGLKTLDVCISDQSAPPEESLLCFYSSPARRMSTVSAKENKVANQFGTRFARSVQLAGRDWKLEVLATPEFMASEKTWRSNAVLGGGLGLTFVLAVYMELVRRGVIRTREYAAAQAAARNELKHEIAERERVEEALREGERRYRTLAQNIPGMVYRGRPDWSAEVFSNSEGICGYKIEDFNLRALNWLDVVHPDDRDRVAKEALQLETVGGDIVQEYRIIDRKNNTRWVEDHKSAQFTDDGEFVGIDGIVFDVTERKRGEDRLIRVNEALLSLGSDFTDNVNRLTALCGELLGATCALYNRLEGSMLRSAGQWHCPPDYNPVDKAEGHICFDVIRRGRSEASVIRHLSKSDYAATDPYVLKYNLESYIGIAVKCVDEFVGALCAVYQSDVEPTEEDKRIMGIVASAVGQEEQRRRAEEAILSNLRFLETFFDTIPNPVFYKDAEGVYLGCNRAFAENILGIRRRQVIGRSVHDLSDVIPSELSDASHKADMKLVAAPGIQVYEAQVQCADGNTRDFIFNKATFTDASGKVKGLVGVMLDITERKRADEALQKAHDELELRVEQRTAELARANEELLKEIAERKRTEQSLRESESLYQSLVDVLPQNVYRTDLQGRVTFGNRAYLAGLGVGLDECLGKTAFDLFPKELAEKYTADDKRVIETGEVLKTVEKHRQRSTGKMLYVQTVRAPVRDPGGTIIGVEGIFWDITESRSAEKALRESEQRYRAIFEQASDSIVLFDAELGDIIDFNDKACRTLGYTREEFAALQIPDFEVDESAADVAAHIRQIVKKGSDVFESRHRRKDGRVLDILVSARTISIGGRTYMQGIWRDITDRKKAEEKLIAYQRQLRSLASELSLSEERVRRRIATEVHDNVGQNLAISKMKLESLVKSASSSKLAKSLSEVSELIGGMIESTRSLTFELSPPVLYELGFEAAVEWLVRKMRKQHGLSTDFVNDRQPKPLDETATVLLFQAVRELLVNVAKHARAGSVIVSAERVGDEVRVSVEDDGIGFDLLDARQAGWQSSGFGLFSIRERLGHIGGRFSIESKPGHGTLATLSVPIDRQIQKAREKRK